MLFQAPGSMVSGSSKKGTLPPHTPTHKHPCPWHLMDTDRKTRSTAMRGKADGAPRKEASFSLWGLAKASRHRTSHF